MTTSEHVMPTMPTAKYAKTLYYVTYLTGGLAFVFAIMHATTQLKKKQRPLTSHILTVVSILASTLLCIPYLWDKPEARYKCFIYLVGWSVVLAISIVALRASA